MSSIARKPEKLPNPRPNEPEAESVSDFAHRANLGRTLIYRAMSSDPLYRGALPHLPSMKVGRARRIRLETGSAWLRTLEAQESWRGA